MTTKAQDKHKMSEIDEGISKIFDIKKRLGKGAYGIVWKALDKRTNETIAVKKIFDAFRDETDAQRTFREIIFLKAFRNHPNIVKLHNVYKASNNLDIYLIFEYMESDLHNIIKRGTILKDIHKRYIMYQLINAIKYIHSGNVIHRDLKPSNVLIDSKCRCKLADFGLARSVANRSLSGDHNDIGSDKPAELLLTDYVATRWYRAPEILVASKRYTKGIDMWSLGCILAEMIRGKPVFQGSSTINQIEKIVYTLPDITEQDIRSVGAGFGSVLLNKQILKDKKTTLNELLCGATGDALDLVKSLLVLDPMGRLTAHQALNHTYVEKFRNSIPELELNVDILPPFRDDVRLTVPEYRSKLYEIVQTHGEKNKSLDTNKNSLNLTKNREHNKSLQNHDKCEQKKPTKIKQQPITSHLEDNMVHANGNLNNLINKALKKTTPIAKKKSTKSLNNNIGDSINNEPKYHIRDDRYLQRSKSHGHQQLLHRQMVGDHLNEGESSAMQAEINVRRFSTNEVEFSKTETLKKSSNTKRLHRSAIALNKPENEQITQHTSPFTSKNIIRQTKSEVIPLNNTPSSESSNVEERICYERRLKKLEDEIERYKNEVKSFCRETFRNSQHKQQLQQPQKHSNEEKTNSKNYNFKSTPKKLTTTINSSNNTPIKNIYFQLLSKGQHHDYHKSELDLSGNSGNGSSSSDHFRNSYNSNSCSGRSKTSTNVHYNKSSYVLQSQQQQQLQPDPQLSQHYVTTHKHQSQHRCRPISKFV
ncbi:hypothetical protein FF38_04847 [Lucilia cuprina]|uniref:Mitogen-activated protein kinase n=1 Tax=Lucilia cuprina TaxID=7375 RepID=A0A0L0BXI8_LUCCU|nr:putative serine/threonine-protein kinase C05D10.2 [Lucilia cuprina]KNC24768.1 hypothetical protein FF38_04847 [Lucilia cuprina]